jgi:hypothetical protein
VYEAIISMRKTYNCDAFFKKWFRKWYKRSNLHMIKFKSLAMKRYEVVTKMQIKNWFDDYTRIMHEMKIRSENLINFDETRFRVECMKRQKVMILIEMKKLYAMSLENRRFCTIIEMINETSDFSSSSMIIVQDMKFHFSNFTFSQISSSLKFHFTQISLLNWLFQIRSSWSHDFRKSSLSTLESSSQHRDLSQKKSFWNFWNITFKIRMRDLMLIEN